MLTKCYMAWLTVTPLDATRFLLGHGTTRAQKWLKIHILSPRCCSKVDLIWLSTHWIHKGLALTLSEMCPEVFGVTFWKPLTRRTCTRSASTDRIFVRHRFSAFWLRSSVVSVLISLISDTSPTRGPYIKLIFGTGRWNRGLLRPLHASTWYCSTSRNGALLPHTVQ